MLRVGNKMEKTFIISLKLHRTAIRLTPAQQKTQPPTNPRINHQTNPINHKSSPKPIKFTFIVHKLKIVAE